MVDSPRALRSRARGAGHAAIVGVIVSSALGGCCRCGGAGGAPLIELAPVPLGPAPPLPFPTGEPRAGGLTPEPIVPRVPAQKGSFVSLQDERLIQGPLHGTVMRDPDHDEDSGRRFVVHRASSAAPVGGAWILVHANTGLWLHEADTLARRARLAAPPISAAGASPDGKAFAFVTGGEPYTLRIVSFPELTLVQTVSSLDEPHRLRFSPDGRRVVLASAARESVTTVDVATGRVLRHDAGDDVNDAIAMPDRASDVAYVTDSDDAFVHDMEAQRQLFTMAPLYRAHAGQLPYMTRDQNAVAHDPATGDLFSGGDDNRVWRISGHRTASPTSAPLGDFDGNVEEVLCCRGTSLVVGLDTLAVHVVKPDGAIEASLGPMKLNVDSDDIRLALMPDQSVLAVLDGRLCRYNPADGLSLVATDYRDPQQWQSSPGRDDTVLVSCRPVMGPGGRRPPQGMLTCFVHRAAHAAAADVEAVRIGAVELQGPPKLHDLEDQSRLILGIGTDHRLRVAVVGPGGALQPAIDTPAIMPGEFQPRADKRAVAFLDATGKLFELGSTAPWIEELGAGPSPDTIERIYWSPDRRLWRIVSTSGETTEIPGRR